MVRYFKEKLLEWFGSFSGITSLFGSLQICHNICLGLVAILSVIGISVTGLPFLFLNEIAVYVWSIAFLLLIITFIIYFKKKCISGKMLLLNAGLVIAGTPFQRIQNIIVIFWVLGGAIILTSVVLFIGGRTRKKK